VQGVTYRVQIILPIDKVSYPPLEQRHGGEPESQGTVTLRYFGDGNGEIAAAEFDRAGLRQGDLIAGPAVIRERLSTTLLGPDQRAAVGSLGEIVIEAV
jgi:N-methylhydantoinase A